MPQSSPRQFEAHMPPPTNHPTSYQIGVPPASSFFEQSYQGDHKVIQIPFHDSVTPFEPSCYLYHWQAPRVEYISDIQPNDGTYIQSEKQNYHYL